MGKKTAYCTIACANYLSRVQILERSLLYHNPDAELHILLCETPEVCKEVSKKAGRFFYSPSDVGCEAWLHMAFYYTIVEFNTALKPFFLETLIKKGYEAVFYLDPDIEIFSTLEEIESLLPECDILLTPHVCKPVPDDGKTPSMDSYIRAGQFNLGFLGISGGSESLALLKWWQKVCLDRCVFDDIHQFFVDQFWADVFPSFVEKTRILRSTAYNVAYWNIFQRRLEHKDGTWLVDGKDLKFFHFSGLYEKDLTMMSIHQNRVRTTKDSDLYRLLSQYYEKKKAQEWTVFDDRPYSFANYSNNEKISDEERKNFLMLSPVEREAIKNPFERYDYIKHIVRISPHDAGKVFYVVRSMRHRFLRPLFVVYYKIREFVCLYQDAFERKGFWAANWYSLRFVLNFFRGKKSP